MYSRDYRDIVGGVALVVIGAAVVYYGMMTLRLGTLAQMGPGMFPVGVGGLLAVFGFVIAIPALFRTGETVHIEFRTAVAILVSILAFALMVRPFGLIPAIAVQTLIASRADSKLSPVGLIVTMVGLSLTAVLIFRYGLSIPFALVAWPW